MPQLAELPQAAEVPQLAEVPQAEEVPHTAEVAPMPESALERLTMVLPELRAVLPQTVAGESAGQAEFLANCSCGELPKFD